MVGIFYWLFRLQRLACGHDWRMVGEAQDAILGEAVILSCSKCGALTREAVGGANA